MSLLYDCSDPEDRADGLRAAEGAIQRGDLVVMPTDTVYGVAADAFSMAGVDAIFRAKGRGRNMPSPVLVGSWGGLDGLVIVVDSVARELIEAFWPGGLSIIVEHAPSLDWDLGETRGTVMVRMPAHPAAIDLLIETGPLAVSSANKSGQAPPRTAEEAREQLGDEVSVYLDAGPSEGTPSTIVDLTGEAPVLRRVGAVSAEALRDVVSDLVIPDELAEAAGVKPAPTVVDTGSAPSPADDAADAPADQTADDAADETADDPAGDAAGPAADPAPDAAAAAESPAETPIETPAETSAETVLDPQIETPAETPIESSTETPTETPIETTGAVDAEPVPESESAPVTGVSEPAVEEDSASER